MLLQVSIFADLSNEDCISNSGWFFMIVFCKNKFLTDCTSWKNVFSDSVQFYFILILIHYWIDSIIPLYYATAIVLYPCQCVCGMLQGNQKPPQQVVQIFNIIFYIFFFQCYFLYKFSVQDISTYQLISLRLFYNAKKCLVRYKRRSMENS